MEMDTGLLVEGIIGFIAFVSYAYAIFRYIRGPIKFKETDHSLYGEGGIIRVGSIYSFKEDLGPYIYCGFRTNFFPKVSVYKEGIHVSLGGYYKLKNIRKIELIEGFLCGGLLLIYFKDDKKPIAI
jgi:hypothetical protein